MRLLTVFRAMWHGLVAPQRIREATEESAVAIFAAAVLVLSLASTAAAFIEEGNADLRAESAVLSQYGMVSSDEELVDLSSAGRQFTAVFGGALMISVGKIVVLAGIFLLFMRFMTNAPVGYRMALAAVGATISIDFVRMAFTVPLHLITNTAQVGPYLGLLASPTEAPFMFTWLQRLDLFSIWQYFAIGVALAVWNGLHYRYGFVVGGIVFAVVQVLFAGASIVAWMLSLSV